MKYILFLLISFNTFAKTEMTWLGQSAVLIKTPKAKLLIDPFIFSNPITPTKFKDEKLYKDIDLILITHAHGDHMGDYKKIMKLSPKAKLVVNPDLGSVLVAKKQITKDQFLPINKSGEITPLEDDIVIAMVKAEHSSAVTINGEVLYGGEPGGFIIKIGKNTIYHAGDTGVFKDMEYINNYYKPTVSLLPIGGTYTMGPKEAAYSVNKFIKSKIVIPIHFGTFPLLKGTPAEFKKYLKKKKSLKVMEPGESIKL